MVKVRDKKELNHAPPIYKPVGEYLSVVFCYGGKFVSSPLPKYCGGSKFILDYVVAKQISLEALRNSIHEWLLMDGDIMIYALINNNLKRLTNGEEVKLYCLESLASRQVVFYVSEGEMVNMLESGRSFFVALETDRESEIIIGDGSSGHKRSADLFDEGNESDNLCDSDYNIPEDSDDEEDDLLFAAHVSDDVDLNEMNESGEDSEIEPDVVNVNMADFDEFKQSDGEQDEPNYPVFDPQVIFQPAFELGMVFSSRQDFKLAVQSHAINTKRTLRFTKTDPTRMYVKCGNEQCKWSIHLIKVKDEETWIIRHYVSKHDSNCDESVHVNNMKSKWLSEKYLNRFMIDREKKPSIFRLDAMAELGCDISKDQACRAKRLAVRKLEGDPAFQFSKLWQYSDELKRTNIGSTVIIGQLEDEEGQVRFDKIYVCLGAVKKGFKAGCRPIIGLDGCHLTGPNNGRILLAAVGVDSNNNIFPIAWSVVSRESRDTWEWFLIVLKQDLQILDESTYTFMSDKQKGLIQAMSVVFPMAAHRFCLRHLHGNMKNAGFRGEAFRKALWNAAEAGTVGEWNHRMSELQAMNEHAWKWLAERPPEQWSKSHFTDLPKCDMLLNNVCEVFNAVIVDARKMPIISMLECIREWLMVRFQKHRDIADLKWNGKICPRIKRILEKNAAMVGDCIPIKGDNRHYQIKSFDGSQYLVDLELWTCSCRIWGLSGIPCKHAICAINHQKKNREDFVHECYSVTTFKKIYAETIFGINGQQLWGKSIIVPPLPPKMDIRRGNGARRKEADEVKLKSNKKTKLRRRQRTVRCKGCGGEGHNSATCGRNYVPDQIGSTITIAGSQEYASSDQVLSLSRTSSAIEEPILHYERLTQESQVPTPSMFNQLKQGQPILERRKKFISLAELQKLRK